MSTTDYAFRVEHNVPMPDIGKGRRKYPWYRLGVGDSFFVPCESIDMKTMFNNLTGTRRWAMEKSGFRFAMRAVEGGIRVWRTV